VKSLLGVLSVLVGAGLASWQLANWLPFAVGLIAVGVCLCISGSIDKFNCLPDIDEPAQQD
jgi:hypothetical protein